MKIQNALGIDLGLGLSGDDVITTEGKDIKKLSLFLSELYMWTTKLTSKWPEPEQQWFNSRGVPVEILRTSGDGWQKGKLRLRLEFIPDNPEAFVNELEQSSTLDDLRADLNIEKP